MGKNMQNGVIARPSTRILVRFLESWGKNMTSREEMYVLFKKQILTCYWALVGMQPLTKKQQVTMYHILNWIYQTMNS